MKKTFKRFLGCFLNNKGLAVYELNDGNFLLQIENVVNNKIYKERKMTIEEYENWVNKYSDPYNELSFFNAF